MPNRSPRRRQTHVLPGGSRNSSHRSPATPAARHRRVNLVLHPRLARHAGVLPRSSSEPSLWATRLVSDGDDGRDDDDDGPEALQMLPRHYTCMDVRPPGIVLSPFTPTSTEGGTGGSNRKWEGKVVVSVTVEGSPGPVRAMVRLGASVEEAIGTVVEAYGREGRSPRLDPAAVASFQLHHNHFCLQSLNKSDTLGQVGGRSFYLRRNGAGSGGPATASCRSDASGGEGGDAAAPMGGEGVARDTSRPHPLALLSADRFLSIIAGRLSKIGRRLMKLWRALGCAGCA